MVTFCSDYSLNVFQLTCLLCWKCIRLWKNGVALGLMCDHNQTFLAQNQDSNRHKNVSRRLAQSLRHNLQPMIRIGSNTLYRIYCINSKWYSLEINFCLVDERNREHNVTCNNLNTYSFDAVNLMSFLIMIDFDF